MVFFYLHFFRVVTVKNSIAIIFLFFVLKTFSSADLLVQDQGASRALAGVGQLVEALACAPKGSRVQSQSGHLWEAIN